MRHLRDNDRGGRRLDPERAVYRRADVIAQYPAEHMDPGPDTALCGVLGHEPDRNCRLAELRGPAKGAASIGPFHPVATQAVEIRAEHRPASGIGLDPRAVHEGRTVAHMLTVCAIEIRDPVAIPVDVKADDRALHGTVPATFILRQCRFDPGYRQGADLVLTGVWSVA